MRMQTPIVTLLNSLDSDQTRHFGPDRGPYCLQRLIADNTSRQRVITKSNRDTPVNACSHFPTSDNKIC